MNTNEIMIAQLNRLIRDIEQASRTDFQMKVRGLFFFLNKCPAIRTLFQYLDSSSNPSHVEAKTVASKELAGTQMNITDEQYREVAAYYLLSHIHDRGLPGRVDLNHIRSNYLAAFWIMLENKYMQTADILSVLLRYIRRTSLYDSERILDRLAAFRKKSPRGARVEENFLAPMINRYLFDNGIEIVSEPKVQNRRVDVLGIMPDKMGFSDFLLEYKVLLKSCSNPEKYLKEGFLQAYSYAKHYQKNIVYLIIFIIGEGDVIIELPQLALADDFSAPCFAFDNVRIIALKVVLKASEMKGEINNAKLISFFKKRHDL